MRIFKYIIEKLIQQSSWITCRSIAVLQLLTAHSYLVNSNNSQAYFKNLLTPKSCFYTASQQVISCCAYSTYNFIYLHKV